MNRFLGAIIDIVHLYCGDVVKFAGDAVSVIFPIEGAPRLSTAAVEAGAAPLPAGTVRLPWQLGGVTDKGVGVGGGAPSHGDGGSRPRAPDMRCAVARATACACELHAQLHNFEAYQEEGCEPIRLALHIGVGCGTVTQLHLGGQFGRWEYVLAGPPISQSADAEPRARSGETCLSPEAWAVVGDLSGGAEASAEPLEGGFMLIRLDDVAAQIAAKKDVCRLPTDATHGGGTGGAAAAAAGAAPAGAPAPFASLPLSVSAPMAAQMMPRLIPYVPTAVRGKLQQGIVSNLDLSEMRSVSVMFINCIRSMVKVASWRGHSWPPWARQAASEGLGLPSALVRRGPAPRISQGGRDLPARGRPSRHFHCG